VSLRIHFRRLLRSRIFLVTATLVLGLGLGVNLILFNTAYALLWRPLGFSQPDRLVTLSGKSSGGSVTNAITGSNAWTLRSESSPCAEIGMIGDQRLVSLLQGDDSVDLASASIDSGYFRALDLQPVAGRFFGPEEDRGSAPETPAILMESVWRGQFAADRSVVGRALRLQAGGKLLNIRVIGVAPASATLPFASGAEILLPIASASPGVRNDAGDAIYKCVSRLRPGVSIGHASAKIDAALRAAEPGGHFVSWGRHWLVPLRDVLAPVKRSTVLLLYCAACLLLLLTCANLTSIFVARSIARAHETSVHLALGATRLLVALTNFHEALLVCAAGTGLAFFVESWARPLVPRYVPALKNVGPELLAVGPVLVAFGIAIWLGVALVVSAASGWRFRAESLAEVLARGGRGAVQGGRFRSVLAAAQLAIVLTLLTVSGMVGRSFLAAMRSNPGIDPRGVVAFEVSLPGSKGSPLPAIDTLAARLATIPGTRGVTFAAALPVGPASFHCVTAAHEGDLRPGDPMVAYRLIGPSYFETLGTSLMAGRAFSPEEVQRWGQVVILNEAAARVLFPGESALGRSVHSAIGDRRNVVVGIAGDIRTEGLDQPTVPMIYMPYASFAGLRFLVRNDIQPAALLPLIKERVRAAQPGAIVQRYQTLDETIDSTVRGRLISGVLVGGFALLGLIVSSVGLYGTVAAQVHQRRQEIGVRIALGAGMRSLLLVFLGIGLRIVAAGALVGTALSIAAGRAIRAELYGVSVVDLTSFGLALGLLSCAAMAACLIPALGAGRVDPMHTLKSD
jgi:predicted permease